MATGDERDRASLAMAALSKAIVPTRLIRTPLLDWVASVLREGFQSRSIAAGIRNATP